MSRLFAYVEARRIQFISPRVTIGSVRDQNADGNVAT